MLELSLNAALEVMSNLKLISQSTKGHTRRGFCSNTFRQCAVFLFQKRHPAATRGLTLLWPTLATSLHGRSGKH